MLAAAAVLAGGVHAQTAPSRPPLPANVAPPPIPDVRTPASPPEAAAPQPLEQYRGGPDDEPQVTIIRTETETMEEVRVGGALRYIRVTPRHGRPYYLMPSLNGQGFMRQESLGSGLSVPMWLLFSW